jgi:hypothetical protein
MTMREKEWFLVRLGDEIKKENKQIKQEMNKSKPKKGGYKKKYG